MGFLVLGIQQRPAVRLVGCLAITWCLGCASGANERASKAAQSGWVTNPPTGCAVGFSGPTLNKGDAVRNARRSALQNLSTRSLAVSVESTAIIGPRGKQERTLQHSYGIVEGARIASMWSAIVRLEGAFRAREVYALACEEGALPALLPPPSYPDWVLNVPRAAARVCALAIAGPTLDPADQEGAALRDGQRSLAELLESEIFQRIEDDGRSLAKVDSRLSPTARAWQRAYRVEELEAQWFDEAGDGPLGLKGILYGIVCSDD